MTKWLVIEQNSKHSFHSYILNKMNEKRSKCAVVAELGPPLKLNTSIVTVHRNSYEVLIIRTSRSYT